MTVYIRMPVEGYSNEIAELVRAFLPGAFISFVEQPPQLQENEIAVICMYKKIDGGVEVCVKLKSSAGVHGIESQYLEKMQGSELQFRRAVKNRTKLLVYQLLESFIGTQLDWGILTGIRPTKIVHQMMDEGVSDDEIVSRLYANYRVKNHKSKMLVKVANIQRPFLKSNNKDKISIYINIPICKTKCLYCSFPSDTVGHCKDMIDDYISCLAQEVRYFGNVIKTKGLKIQTVYVGGGTPTSISCAQLERVLCIIDELKHGEQLDEYTVEGGRPDSMSKGKLGLLKAYGVNRISINPQSMNKETLAAIGRGHTPEDVVECFYNARELGFGCINMDVIIGLPGENPDDVEHTMESIAELDPDNVTVHTLAIKRASILRECPKQYSLVDGKTAKEMLDVCNKWTLKMGLYPYYLYRQKYMLGNLENVGYTKPGNECIYNIQIMEEKQGIWAFGAGAISKVYYDIDDRIERVANVKSIQEYIQRIGEMIERKRKIIESG